jgi:hypothetical protein
MNRSLQVGSGKFDITKSDCSLSLAIDDLNDGPFRNLGGGWVAESGGERLPRFARATGDEMYQTAIVIERSAAGIGVDEGRVVFRVIGEGVMC